MCFIWNFMDFIWLNLMCGIFWNMWIDIGIWELNSTYSVDRDISNQRKTLSKAHKSLLCLYVRTSQSFVHFNKPFIWKSFNKKQKTPKRHENSFLQLNSHQNIKQNYQIDTFKGIWRIWHLISLHNQVFRLKWNTLSTSKEVNLEFSTTIFYILLGILESIFEIFIILSQEFSYKVWISFKTKFKLKI